MALASGDRAYLYKINQNTFHLKEGQAIFGNANALHAGYMYQDQDCQYIPITFDPKLIYGFSGSLLFQKYTEPILRSFSLSAVPLDLSCKWHSEAIKDIRDIIDLDKPVSVVFDDFGDNSVNLFVTYWVLVEEKFGKTGQIKEAIYNTLNAHNIEIPFPQRDIHIIESK